MIENNEILKVSANSIEHYITIISHLQVLKNQLVLLLRTLDCWLEHSLILHLAILT